MSWSTSELGWGWGRETNWSPPGKYFYWPNQGGTSFVDHLCCLCLVFFMLLRLFIAVLWSPAGKGLTSKHSFVMFYCVLSLSHVVSWVRCGTWLYRFLIFATFLFFVHNCTCFKFCWHISFSPFMWLTQAVLNQIRCRSMRCQIWILTVCSIKIWKKKEKNHPTHLKL